MSEFIINSRLITQFGFQHVVFKNELMRSNFVEFDSMCGDWLYNLKIHVQVSRIEIVI